MTDEVRVTKHQDRALVAVMMGSDSDLPVMTETARTLAALEIPFEVEISSAHRSPHRTAEYPPYGSFPRPARADRGRGRRFSSGRSSRRRDYTAGDCRAPGQLSAVRVGCAAGCCADAQRCSSRGDGRRETGRRERRHSCGSDPGGERLAIGRPPCRAQEQNGAGCGRQVYTDEKRV